MRDVAVKTCKEALPALTTNLVDGLVAGVVLRGIQARPWAVPGPLILVPALLMTRSNVYSSLDVRIATVLHQGPIEPRVTGGDKRLRVAATVTLANGVLTSTFTTIAAHFFLTFLGNRAAPLPILVGIAIVVGLPSSTVLTVVVVSVIFAGYRHGRSPDTVVSPVVTTAGDVFSALFLLIAVKTILAIAGIF